MSIQDAISQMMNSYKTQSMQGMITGTGVSASKEPVAPKELVEQAEQAIAKCHERCIAAVESGKHYNYDAPVILESMLRNQRVFSTAQLEKFKTKLDAIEEECRQLAAKITLTKYITGVYAEEQAEQAKKAQMSQTSVLTSLQQAMQNQAVQNNKLYGAQYTHMNYDPNRDTTYVK